MSENAKESMTRINNALGALHPDDAEKVAEFAAAYAEGFARGASVRNSEEDNSKKAVS